MGLLLRTLSSEWVDMVQYQEFQIWVESLAGGVDKFSCAQGIPWVIDIQLPAEPLPKVLDLYCNLSHITAQLIANQFICLVLEDITPAGSISRFARSTECGLEVGSHFT